MLVHLSLQDAEFVKFRLSCHAKSTIAVGTARQTCPEVRKLPYHTCIVAYGSSEISCLVEKNGTIEYGKHIVRLHAYDEVEIGDGTIVVAKLHTQKTTVVMCEKILWVKVDGCIIIRHSTSKIVEIVTCKGTVDVRRHVLRLEVYGLAEESVGVLPFASREAYHSTLCPCLRVIGVDFETAVEPFGILLSQINLCLQRISTRKLLPFHHYSVKVELCLCIVFLLHTAERTVIPCRLVLRIKTQ